MENFVEKISLLDLTELYFKKNKRVKGRFECPNCGSMTFQVYRRDNRGFCFTCGSSFSVAKLIKLQSGVSDYKKINLIAKKLVEQKGKGLKRNAISKTKVPDKHVALASTYIRTIAYKILLQLVDLDKKDYEELINRRKLIPAVIKQERFFSTPNDTEEFTLRLNEKIDELQVQKNLFIGVPGFYKSKNQIRFYCPKGIGIPIYDSNRAIIGIQVRTNFKDGKYLWASSSSFPTGIKSETGAAAFIPRKVSKRVLITEGWFKGQALYQATHQAVLALAGVNNQGTLISQLKDVIDINLAERNNDKTIKEISDITLVFDSDLMSKIQVLSALKKLITLIKEHFEVKINVLLWKPSYGKGFDDVYNDYDLSSVPFLIVPGNSLLDFYDSIPQNLKELNMSKIPLNRSKAQQDINLLFEKSFNLA